MHRRLPNTVSLSAGVSRPLSVIWPLAPPRRFFAWPTVVLISAAIMVGGTSIRAAEVDNPDISARRAAERTSFSDDEIKDGFFKTAFRGELQFDRQAGRIRKFDEPVRVFIVNHGTPDRRAEIAAVIADIRAHIDHLDLATTDNRQAANFIVTLVHGRDLPGTIRSRYGTDKARQIQRSLDPQCLSGIGKDSRFRIRRAEVFLPVDDGDFTFYDCAYEELLQGLGIINDDNSVPWTMFNDDVQMGFFDVYDQYLVNILYDPRVRAGMTKSEVDQRLPEVLPSVRAWVARTISQAGADSHASASAGPKPQ
jgi:Protein of unknown function (DUF2927)